MATPALSRSERRKSRTTPAIMDAAERHFLERGFQDAKVDEIAEEADVAVGSVYNHFGSKEGLYCAALERALALFETYMDEGPEPEGTALEQLLEVAGRVARFGRERPGHLRMLVLPQPRQAEEALREPLGRVRKALAAQERRTAALIEAAVRRGDARPLDSRRAAAFLWSAWLGTLALGERSDRELRAVLEAGLRVVLGGIAAEGGGAGREWAPGASRVLAPQLRVNPPPLDEPLESAGLPKDALALATRQTGVPLVAFDAARMDGSLALRKARAGERLGQTGPELEEGQVVMADRRTPVALVLGKCATDSEVSADTERIVIATIQAKGVPTLAVEEALWTAIEVLRERI